jgi:hypothetical protein
MNRVNDVQMFYDGTATDPQSFVTLPLDEREVSMPQSLSGKMLSRRNRL